MKFVELPLPPDFAPDVSFNEIFDRLIIHPYKTLSGDPQFTVTISIVGVVVTLLIYILPRFEQAQRITSLTAHLAHLTMVKNDREKHSGAYSTNELPRVGLNDRLVDEEIRATESSLAEALSRSNPPLLVEVLIGEPGKRIRDTFPQAELTSKILGAFWIFIKFGFLFAPFIYLIQNWIYGSFDLPVEKTYYSAGERWFMTTADHLAFALFLVVALSIVGFQYFQYFRNEEKKIKNI